MIKTKNDMKNTQSTESQVVMQNNTHIAYKNGNLIAIYIKGFEIDDLKFEPEHLWSINANEKDDLFAIFERLEENNRCNLAEFNESINQ